MGLVKCSKCGESKHNFEYYSGKKQCKECVKDRVATWSSKQPVKRRRKWVRRFHQRNPSYQKDYDLQRNYGICLGQFEQLLFEQHFRCGICDRMLDPPHVDHNHATGEVRGLLCTKCNLGLGCFEDNPDSLRSAAEYLDAP